MITGTPVEFDDDDIYPAPGTISTPPSKPEITPPEPAPAENIAERRSAIERRLAELKHERAVATVDGTEFKGLAEIRNLTEDLEALVDAEGEATRRQRELSEMRRCEQRKSLRTELVSIEKRRLEVVETAEAAATELMVSLRDIQTYAERQGAILQLLGVKVWDVTAGISRNRFSVRLATLMKPILTDGFQRFGEITFPHPRDNPGRSWTEEEKNIVAPEIEKAFQPANL